MSIISVPEKAVGHVGMLAMIKRVEQSEIGKLVVLREAAGYVTSLVGSEKPVFAWLTRALGQPMNCRGKLSRDLYVADACLTPVGEMTPGQIKKLVRGQTDVEFAEALEDLRKILRVQNLTPDDLEGAVKKAADHFAIDLALTVVPAATVLREMGFVSKSQGNEHFQWTGIHDGTELEIDAYVDWSGNVRVVGHAISVRQWVWDERLLPAEAPLGKSILTILSIWRTAFSKATVPSCFELGVLYEQHIEVMKKMNPGLPILAVDPKVFRSALKWLKQGQFGLWDNDSLLLSFSDGLLRFDVNGLVYGCPAYGKWAVGCKVRFSDFMQLTASISRSRRIELRQMSDYMSINGAQIDAISGGESDHD